MDERMMEVNNSQQVDMREWIQQSIKEINFRARVTREEQEAAISEQQAKINNTVKDVIQKSEEMRKEVFVSLE